MTKEELIKIVKECVENGGLNYKFHKIIEGLNEFFDSNVCISKGEHRHPYADVLHEWIEGVGVEFYTEGKYDILLPATSVFDIEDTYRIKPSEPIYEWQWYSVIDGCVDDTTDTWESKQWLTEKEMITCGSYWHKFEETKRERKWVRT